MALADNDVWDVHRQPPFPEAASPQFAVMPANPDVTGLRDVFALVRHNAVLIMLLVLLSLGAGAAYLAFAPPRYIATATLLVDPASSSIPQEYYIESQTQMMRSDLVVRAVIDRLDLVNAGLEQDDRSFLMDHARAAKQYLGLFVPALSSNPENSDPVQRAVSTLRRNLTIARPAMTPVISITYNSTDPGRAADVVNTLVQAYTSQRQHDQTAAAQQSVAWVKQHLDELRQQLESAERGVENFKTANNIVGVGTNHSLQAEQRLYELGMQLDRVRAATDLTRMRHSNMQDASETAVDVPTKAMPAVNETAMLSQQSPATKQRRTQFRSSLQTDAPSPVIPATGFSRSDVGLAEEQHGTAAASSDDIADARRAQASLQQAFEEAARRAGELNRQKNQLRELEASAGIYRTLHSNMLQRYEEAVQQGSLPLSDGVQVLIAARRPDGRSHPRPLLVLAFAAAFGVALGVGTAAARVRV